MSIGWVMPRLPRRSKVSHATVTDNRRDTTEMRRGMVAIGECLGALITAEKLFQIKADSAHFWLQDDRID